MKKRKVEVFSAGCQVCKPTIELVKKTACPSCEVIVYDLNKGCDSDICKEKAHKYNITRVPSVVVDGKLLDCCKDLAITEDKLKEAGVGRA
ncbi:MAG: glutaredoxin [Halobacteriovoraceae bacterium]|nr:glutaredoxin [Halobacteriovoraceae bacterium]|tara:strand:+ start:12553 stop:12825 length:273 start_codon:yes stop_codon:yes gene_type:complete